MQLAARVHARHVHTRLSSSSPGCVCVSNRRAHPRHRSTLRQAKPIHRHTTRPNHSHAQPAPAPSPHRTHAAPRHHAPHHGHSARICPGGWSGEVWKGSGRALGFVRQPPRRPTRSSREHGLLTKFYCPCIHEAEKGSCSGDLRPFSSLATRHTAALDVKVSTVDGYPWDQRICCLTIKSTLLLSLFCTPSLGTHAHAVASHQHHTPHHTLPIPGRRTRTPNGVMLCPSTSVNLPHRSRAKGRILTISVNTVTSFIHPS
jgi:hypothetical protein